jgi:hypothetical protein
MKNLNYFLSQSDDYPNKLHYKLKFFTLHFFTLNFKLAFYPT